MIPLVEDNDVGLRIMERVKVNPKRGCWLWTGPKNRGGYGMVRITVMGVKRNVLAHRALYASLNGPIQDGMLVCHHCDVPSCCNPEHLFVGTHKDNAWDAIKKGRLSKGRVRKAKKGARILGEQVRALRMERGMTQEQLAAASYCSSITISKLERNLGNPRRGSARFLAEALGVKQYTLRGEAPRPPRHNILASGSCTTCNRAFSSEIRAEYVSADMSERLCHICDDRAEEDAQ